MQRKRRNILLIFVAAGLCSSGATLHATPETASAIIRTLKPGDTLRLAGGRYTRLPITNVNGRSDAWITITGPTSGPPAIIQGERDHNTVEIYNSSYVSLENLRIDSLGIPGAFGISAKQPENVTHHIRIESNILVGQNVEQQTVAISTKAPTWGWEIRNNQILGAGTGIYLGNSDGTQPFVDGIIENNLIVDTIGYCAQIKDQVSFPPVAGMPTGPTTTIIRNNVFIKNDQPSPDGDRPNLLVSAFPNAGAGSMNTYEIYGNVFVHNHREALFQGSGRISLHDNIFVDGSYSYPAVVLRNQQYALKLANVYNNTVYTQGRGIYFGSRALLGDVVTGNLVLSSEPISGSITNQVDNIVDSFENASRYLKLPSLDLGKMDFHPLAKACQGPPVDLSWFRTEAEYLMDFDGLSKPKAKGAVVCRGAYAGESDDSTWKLARTIKPPHPPSPVSTTVLGWIEPRSAAPGSSIAVELTGANFQRGSTITVAGTGVSVTNVIFVSETQLRATLVVDRRATGIHEVSIVAPNGMSNAFPFPVKPR